jgi:glycosyltransferase 2 family protein
MLIRLRRLAGRPWVRLTLLAVVLGCCGYRLHSQWPQVTSALGRLHWYSISLSIAAAVAGSACMMLAWRAILTDLGSPLPARVAGRINFTANLGKYVPGAVWAFAAQVELGHDYRVPRRRSFASVIVSLAITVSVGLALALVTLPAASPEIARRYWWALAVLPLVIAALCPPVLGILLDRMLAVLHRAPLDRRPSFLGLTKAVAWNLAGWLMLGLQVWILLPGISGLHGRTLLLCTGGYALAFSVGLMLVVLPSGIGARDLILIAALATLLPYGSASAIAIMTRLGTTVTDLGLGAVGIALGRQAVRARATAAANAPSGQPAAAANVSSS